MKDVIGREFTCGPCPDCAELRSKVEKLERYVRRRLARSKIHSERQSIFLYAIVQMDELGLTGLGERSDAGDVHGDSEVDDAPG